MYTKVVKSGSLVEIYEYEREPCRARELSKAPRRKRIVRRRTDSNIRYCRNAFKRLVRANLRETDTPALLTLTMRDVVDIGQAFKLYSRFGFRFQRKFGRHTVRIAVPEFQKRGAVHFHVLVWGLGHETIEGERSSRAIADLWGAGFVDVVATDGNARLASYLAKYMSKAMHDDRLVGKRAYSSTRNVVRPVSVNSKWPFALSLALEEWGVSPVDSDFDEKREYDTLFLGRCFYRQINLRTTK